MAGHGCIEMAMTKAQAVKLWRAEVLPGVKSRFERAGRPDFCARSQAWNDWTDGLCKDRQITLRQYETWTHPPENSRRERRIWQRRRTTTPARTRSRQ